MTTADPRAVATTVTDPELPMLTLADLGVLQDVRVEHDGGVVVELSPTYPGCPAMAIMRADLVRALQDAGFAEVDVRTVLSPPWSTDWITADGRRKLVEAGIAPPGAATAPPADTAPAPDAVPLVLGPTRRTASCPLCGSTDTEQVAEFATTACKALRRCRSCREPFEHLKEV